MKTLVKLAAAIAFLLLTALAFEVHELSHHFFGWAVCGAPGTISFTQFEVARGCGVSESRLTELFGPLMGMSTGLWRGILGAAARFALWVRPDFRELLSSSVPAVALGWGKRRTGSRSAERLSARLAFRRRGGPVCSGPAAAGDCVARLRGRWKAAVFALAYVMPVLILAISDKVDAFFTGANPALPGLASARLLNIPEIVLLVNLGVATSFLLFARLLRGGHAVGRR